MDTTRRYPRTYKDAFRIYPESCLGVEKPIEVGYRPFWFSLWRWITRR